MRLAAVFVIAGSEKNGINAALRPSWNWSDAYHTTALRFRLESIERTCPLETD